MRHPSASGPGRLRLPSGWCRRALGAALAVVVLGSGPSARAYCRTTVCTDGTAGQRCEPPQPDDCGTELYWAKDCIGFSVNEEASKHVDLETAEEQMALAFGAWTMASCAPSGKPSIAVHNLGPVSCAERAYNQKAGNTNLVVFHDDAWPYAGAGYTLALTTVTFNLDTGEIFDADLEVNGTVDLTVGNTAPEYDLLSILTHECGHILGLAHSKLADATMYIEYVPGDLDLRDLDPDDVAAICDAYPPGEEEGVCDPTPRHGFASECHPQPAPEPESCSCRSAGAGGNGDGWLLVAAGALGRWYRRRQR